jgi:phosphoribosylglycinamide formyltransferase-1
MARRRIGVLISGRGSNLKALVEAAAAPDYPAEIVLVVADRADAGGLGFAESVGIATAVVPYREIRDKPRSEAEVDALLRGSGVELVCLAGFMRVLSPTFVEAWRDRMINIHPSLLPSFPGLDTHARAIAAGVKLHGCTVHFVRSEVDSGPIIAQAAVPVEDGDTPDTLSARVLTAEHRLYPLALRLVAGGEARVEGERVSGGAVLLG